MSGSHVQLGDMGAFSPDAHNHYEVHIRGTREHPEVVFPTWNSDELQGGFAGGVLPMDGSKGPLSLENVMVLADVPGVSDLVHVSAKRVFEGVEDIRQLLDDMMQASDAEAARS